MARRPSRSLLVLAAMLGVALPVQAQGVIPTLLGTATGLAVGGLAAAGVETERSEGTEYRFWQESPTAWRVAPVAVGALGGAWLGSTDVDRLERAALGAFVGVAVGTGIGSVIGPRMRPEYEAWATPLMGGAAGAAAGALLGVIWPGGSDDDRQPPRGPILPLSLSILF